MEIIPLDERLKIRRWFRDNRLLLFYATMGGSSFISLITIQGFFNLFFYALLAMVIVRMREETYANLPLPTNTEILFGALICAGSFIFDIATREIFGGGYGQTDYSILVIGILFLFFGYKNIRVLYLPIILVGGLSVSLKTLEVIYENFFEEVANWFVNVIANIAGPGGMGYPIYPGEQSGVFTVHGINETGSLKVDWGCTGLRSLVMFSFILAALIWPMYITIPYKFLGLAIGVLGAFLINILRLIMLALIMYYRDMATTLIVHKHLGDFLFILWMALYWWLFFRFFASEEEYAESTISVEAGESDEIDETA